MRIHKTITLDADDIDAHVDHATAVGNHSHSPKETAMNTTLTLVDLGDARFETRQPGLEQVPDNAVGIGLRPLV